MGKCKIIGGGGTLKVKNSMERNVMNATSRKIDGNIFLQRVPAVDIDNGITVSYGSFASGSGHTVKSVELADHSVLVCMQSSNGTYSKDTTIYATVFKNVNGTVVHSNTLDLPLLGNGLSSSDALIDIGCAEDENGNIMLVMQFQQTSTPSVMIYKHIILDGMNLTAGAFAHSVPVYTLSCLSQNGQSVVQDIKYAKGVFTSAFAYTPTGISSSTQYYQATLLVFRSNSSGSFTVEETTFSRQHSSSTACVFINSHVIGAFLVSIFCIDSYLTCYVTNLTKTTTNLYQRVADNSTTTVNSSKYGAFSEVIGENDVLIESLYLCRLYRGIQVRIVDDGTPTIVKILTSTQISQNIPYDGATYWASRALDKSRVLLCMKCTKSSSDYHGAALLSLDSSGEVVIKSTSTAPTTSKSLIPGVFTGIFRQDTGRYIALYSSSAAYMEINISNSEDVSLVITQELTSEFSNSVQLTCSDDTKPAVFDRGAVATFESANAQRIDSDNMGSYNMNFYYRPKFVWGVTNRVDGSSIKLDINVKPVAFNANTGEFTHYVKPYNDLVYGISKKSMLPSAAGIAYIPTAMPESTAYGLAYSMVDRVVEDIKTEVTQNVNTESEIVD